MTYTISQLGELFGLSRSALLYYDKKGLLCSTSRSPSSYRIYSEADRDQLEKITSLRKIGMSIKQIKKLLLSDEDGLIPLLMARLVSLNHEMETLKHQQTLLLEMIEVEGSLKNKKPFLKKLAAIGEEAGIHAGNYETIHRMFESNSPDSHKRLLRFLGFSESEIKIFIKKIKQKT